MAQFFSVFLKREGKRRARWWLEGIEWTYDERSNDQVISLVWHEEAHCTRLMHIRVKDNQLLSSLLAVDFFSFNNHKAVDAPLKCPRGRTEKNNTINSLERIQSTMERTSSEWLKGNISRQIILVVRRGDVKSGWKQLNNTETVHRTASWNTCINSIEEQCKKIETNGECA